MAFDFFSGFGITTIADVLWLFVQTLIIFVVIVIADRVVSHGVDIKHALILSFAAYFLVLLLPFGLSLTGISLPYFVIAVLPILVWIALGEILLEGDFKTKLIVAVIAYAAYIIINVLPVHSFVTSLIPL